MRISACFSLDRHSPCVLYICVLASGCTCETSVPSTEWKVKCTRCQVHFTFRSDFRLSVVKERSITLMVVTFKVLGTLKREECGS
ncbi:Crossover junction endodeoxyribonuclease RuvC [Trichinella spiralis]|uniref:Crossover junction endodeoxyribonuclease RuvC n=1 Tax=Trichinella spiralis TaxID=6334 RepID=A0ABR3K873_TRISP